MKALALVPVTIFAVACAPVAEPGQPAERMAGEGRTCSADAAQEFVGQLTSKAVGEQIAAATGAGIFQWVGPDMAVTMDYRPDRVRVSYDRAMKIVSVVCG
ncbi:I78 family peptidase inhibitor [Parerythrobacter aurantius]|uniref:I78 family peptidase inhibitor n=1 Tax=Parerythrobacter aurantius TaxID=3127706 RepID=UPI0032536051